jgi:hypothetical protein
VSAKPPEDKKIILTDADPIVGAEPTAVIARPAPALAPSENIFREEYRSWQRSIAQILKHTLVLLPIVLMSYGLHHLLSWMGDPKLFDYIPWRWSLDAADAINST